MLTLNITAMKTLIKTETTEVIKSKNGLLFTIDYHAETSTKSEQFVLAYIDYDNAFRKIGFGFVGFDEKHKEYRKTKKEVLKCVKKHILDYDEITEL